MCDAWRVKQQLNGLLYLPEQRPGLSLWTNLTTCCIWREEEGKVDTRMEGRRDSGLNIYSLSESPPAQKNSKTKNPLQVVCGFAMRLCLVCNNVKVGGMCYSNFHMAAKSQFPSRSLHDHWHSLHLSVLLILCLIGVSCISYSKAR